MDKMKILDLNWGHTPIIGQRYLEVFHPDESIAIKGYNFTNYPPLNGSSELLDTFKAFVKKYMGVSLDRYYGVVTNGAAQALNILAYTLKSQGVKEVFYPAGHYYSKVPLIFRANGISVGTDSAQLNQSVANRAIVSEVPSNPLANKTVFSSSGNFCAVDLAYFTPTYLARSVMSSVALTINTLKPQCLIFSYGKMSGMNSLRVGFAFFANEADCQRALDYLAVTTLGVSWSAQLIVASDLKKQEWDKFFEQTSMDLAQNRLILREALLSVRDKYNLKFVGEEGGMFLTVRGKGLLEDLERAGIQVMSGDKFGLTKEYVRFSSAQAAQIVRRAAEVIREIGKRSTKGSL